ncbi:4'-phosphopantetheinyl transferase superfamily protein [Streptomyces anulatus]|uniref:4'-phosphopantetheinyl transferase family protein n=1 Tax=Streptomyces anulatus TaxID=1892 RepID=UPI002DDAC6DE|nr:4'-phosphopantetheinyl transferase superfamily protein [Streptomyces anulatus]WSC64682.1 4'-phosphopantetheinyl transferase superfamily protein [Streptomyces anulatus]
MRDEGGDGGIVDVWYVPLVAPPDGPASLTHLLDRRERAECERIPPGPGRIRYAVSHAAYRTALARYCDVPPQAVRWRHSAHGKPYLDRLPDAPHSSLSHAGDLAAIAVSRRRGVGIDLACPGPGVREAALAARFFTPEEAGAVATGESFSRLWARKEACVKAVGATFVDGLRLPVMREGPLRGRAVARSHVVAARCAGARPVPCGPRSAGRRPLHRTGARLSGPKGCPPGNRRSARSVTRRRRPRVTERGRPARPAPVLPEFRLPR